jgi:hypothetical protein
VLVDFFYQPPVSVYLTAVFVMISMVSMIVCIIRFRKAYHEKEEYLCAVWFIKAIRSLLISLTASAWAASLFWNQTWLFIIGLVIICQELWEGAVLSSILKKGMKVDKGENVFP